MEPNNNQNENIQTNNNITNNSNVSPVTNSLVNESPVTGEITSMNNNVITPQPQTNTFDPFNPLPQNSPSGNKKNPFIIIGAVILVVVVVVLIVLSNTDSKNNNSASGNKTSGSDILDDGPKMIYYYNMTSKDLGYESKTASTYEEKDSEDYAYKEIFRYECKSDCIYEVEEDYDTYEDILYILDEDKIYEYDEENDSLKELVFDKELKSDDTTFRMSDEYIAAFNDRYLTVSTDKINLYGLTGDVKSYKRVYTTRDMFKEDLFFVVFNYEDYSLCKFHNKDNLFAEIKDDDLVSAVKIIYDGTFITVDNASSDHLIVSKNGKVKVIAFGDKYTIYDDKLVTINDKGNVEIYNSDEMISTYEADDARVTGRGYVAMIKDNKLLLFDALNNEYIYDFGILKDNERFFYKKELVSSIGYYEYEDIARRITIYMVDESTLNEEKALGKKYEYDFITKEGRIDDSYSYSYIHKDE